MKVDFSTISQESKVWIYQADRFFTTEEAALAEKKLNQFVENWQSHGQPVKAAGKLLHNLFIVLAADEDYNAPGGCSIDSSVHFTKTLEQEFGINLFNRSTLALFSNERISLIPLTDIKEAINKGLITKETLFFNNLTPNLASFQNHWLTSFGGAWTSRYFA